MKRMFLLIWGVIALSIMAPLSIAQSDELLAFLNGSGQLVVSSGDGTTRWIVTNPGQVVTPSSGFNWDESGNLVFALDGYGAFEGDPATQAIIPVETNDASNLAFLRGMSNRPNVYIPDGISSDGEQAFVWSDGRYFVVNLASGSGYRLPLVGDNDAQGSGLWADTASWVAYWGFDNESGSTAISVFDVATETSLLARSGGSIPMPPIAWQPDSARLIFRTGTGEIHLADVACLVSGCGVNPLEQSIILAPSSANQVQVTADRIYYVDTQTLYTVPLACVDAGDCVASRVAIGQNVVPLSMMHVSANRLVYTAFTSNPNDPSDHTVQLVDLTCVPDCAPQPILTGAIAGLLSPSGDYLMVDIVGKGLNILSLSGNSLTYLTDTMGGQLGAGLTGARWR